MPILFNDYPLHGMASFKLHLLYIWIPLLVPISTLDSSGLTSSTGAAFGVDHPGVGRDVNLPYGVAFIDLPIRILFLLIGLAVILFLFMPTTVQALQVTLAWEPSSGPVTGYRVYYGQQSGYYPSTTPTAPDLITTTIYTTPDLPAGTYYFAVKAFDSAGNESGFSNEVNTAPVGGSQLVNLSSRDWVGTGDNVMIAGFIIGGSSPKQVLIRVIGPAMASADVPNLLYDPTLTLYSGQTVLTSNDNWQDTQAAEIQATGMAPPNPSESAILTTLNPGPYTAIIRGVSDTTGNALVDVYGIDHPESRLINISTRGLTETGDNVMIAGFVIGGNGPKQVLIRAIGPTLSTVGVPGALADPTLTLYSGQTVLTSNDNWQDTQAAVIQATGMAPPNPNESAILITLDPGPYTAIVRGVNGTVGNTLVEVHDLGD